MNILLSYNEGERDLKKSLLLLLVFMFVMPLSPKAESELKKREDVFAFLQQGFEAQVALSEKVRTKEEIEELLNPYFSNNYQREFWNANVVEEEEHYITYGSDFAPYYIPYYQFSNRTHVYFSKSKIYVYEYFPESSDGPVGYKSHYEGLLIKKIKGEWKVCEYLFDNIPKTVLTVENKKFREQQTRFSFFKIKRLYS
jgi:hypothetical protein